MSDDGRGDDEGDFVDDFVDDGDGLPESDGEPAAAADGIEGLDEDAAGTDSGSDSGTDAEYEPLVVNAAPQRARVDPILRMANTPTTVVLIPPEEHTSDDRLQRTEAAAVLAMRAEQIAKYATKFTEAPGQVDPYAIAYKELYDRRCPLRLRRVMGVQNGVTYVEEWNIREMVLPAIPPP